MYRAGVGNPYRCSYLLSKILFEKRSERLNTCDVQEALNIAIPPRTYVGELYDRNDERSYLCICGTTLL